MNCETAYILVPPDPTDVAALLQPLIGQRVTVSMIDTWLQKAHINVEQLGWLYDEVVPLKWLSKVSGHKFPDTGAQRSWCECGAVGHFDWRQGKYCA